MRLLPASLLFSLLTSVVVAEAPEQRLGAADIPGEIASPASEESVEEGPRSTIFNGVKVPPIPDIEGERFATTVKDGYWFVKHYSWATCIKQLIIMLTLADPIALIAFILRPHGKHYTNSIILRSLCQQGPPQIPHPLL